MHDASLTGHPLSSNDVSHLAKLIETNLFHFCSEPPHKACGYINSLGVLAGLGFCAAMACGVVFQYEPRLRLFFQTHPNAEMNKKQPESRKNFAATMALILNDAAYYFKCAAYPAFHESFVATANQVCRQMALTLGEEGEVIRGLFEALVAKNN